MVTFVRYPTTDWGPPFGRLLKPHKSKMEGDIQVRFYRDCIYTSYILQLEERPWSVSTAIVAVREPSRTGNRGAAAPIFWPGRRCLPELAEGDRKVGCRRPTFLKSAKRRQMIWFYRLGSHVFSDARERMDALRLGMGTPPREPVSRDSQNRSRRFLDGGELKICKGRWCEAANLRT